LADVRTNPKRYFVVVRGFARGDDNMEALSPLHIGFCALVLTAAFTVRGGTGFGSATIAVPMLAFVMPIGAAVAVVAALNIINSLGMVKRDWRKIAWPQLKRLLPYTMAGIAAGLYLMAILDDSVLRHALGLFLIAYSIYALAWGSSKSEVSERWHTPLAATTGTIGGFFGALFGGATGPIYAIYLNVLKLDKEAFRVTVTTVILIGLFARISGYAGLGFYDGAVLVMLLAAFPTMFLGAWLGDRVVQRLDQKKFGRFVGCTLLVSGVALVIK
jgi:uncharacterized protein